MIVTTVFGDPDGCVRNPSRLTGLNSCIRPLNTGTLIVIAPSNGGHINTGVRNNFTRTGTRLLFRSFGNRYSGNRISHLITLTHSGNYSVVININNNGVLSATGTITCCLRSPIVVYPAVTSASTPYSTLSILCASSNRFSGCLFLGTGPGVILVSAAIVTTDPIHLAISNVNSTLTACFRTRTARSTSNNAYTNNGNKVTNLTLTGLYCRALVTSNIGTGITLRGNTLAPTIRRVVRTGALLSNVNFRDSNLTTTRTVRGNLAVLPRYRNVCRNRGITFNAVIRLMLRSTPARGLRRILNFYVRLNLPIAVGRLNITRLAHRRTVIITRTTYTPRSAVYGVPFRIAPRVITGTVLNTSTLNRCCLVSRWVGLEGKRDQRVTLPLFTVIRENRIALYREKQNEPTVEFYPTLIYLRLTGILHTTFGMNSSIIRLSPNTTLRNLIHGRTRVQHRSTILNISRHMINNSKQLRVGSISTNANRLIITRYLNGNIVIRSNTANTISGRNTILRLDRLLNPGTLTHNIIIKRIRTRSIKLNGRLLRQSLLGTHLNDLKVFIANVT